MKQSTVLEMAAGCRKAFATGPSATFAQMRCVQVIRRLGSVLICVLPVMAR
jgi:hypothetical protein